MENASKYLIIFDTTKVRNDKEWLYHEAKNIGLDCHALYAPCCLASFERKSVLHKIIAKGIILYLAIYSRIFYPKHTIVTWRFLQGIYCYRMLGRSSRKLIAMNWLSPPTKKTRHIKVEKKMVTDERVSIIVNSRDSIPRWSTYLSCDIAVTQNTMSVVPDVFRIDTSFEAYSRKKQRYVFCGGMANRHWAFLVAIAKKLPDIKFECVALKDEWQAKVTTSIPDNVNVQFNTPSDVYYELMDNATLVVLPLENDRVSGLINITRAMQKSILCLVTNYSCTQQYFSEAMAQKYLLENDVTLWKERIQQVFQYNDDEYRIDAKRNQDYLLDNFSPNQAVKKLLFCTKEKC